MNEAEFWAHLAGNTGVKMVLMFDLPQEKTELGIKYFKIQSPNETKH